MNIQVLTTKLLIPPLQSRTVSRPRLIHQLDSGLRRKLCLLSAPAGFGKTTLLSQWAQQCGVPLAWLTIDERDNDLSRFLTYFVAGIRRVKEGFGEGLLSQLQTPRTRWQDKNLIPLINEIASDLPEFVFVLDDLHLVTSEDVHNTLVFIIENMPPTMHLVIATRADPPLPIPRWRGKGLLLEVRSADLRFTPQEITQLLVQVMDYKLSPEEIMKLADHLEGWIAGVQMLALSMRGREDLSEFVATFTGSHEYIMDYLADEVVRVQPGEIQSFLLQTSILGTLTGPLCDTVTGGTGGGEMLAYLHENNTFITPLDRERRSYRYHKLFAELLQQRLIENQPDNVPVLHSRAKNWFETQGMFSEAIHHALSGRDFQGAASLIEKQADVSLMQGEIVTFLNWVEALPEQVARQYPLLCVYHAEALLLVGKPMDHVVKRLQGAQEYDAVQALMSSYRGEIQLSRELSKRALDLLPADSYFLKAAISSSLAALLLLSGDINLAIQAYSEVEEIARESSNMIQRVIALCRLSQLHSLKGANDRAQRFCSEALNVATKPGGGYLPVASLPLATQAYLSLQMNHLDSALRDINLAIELTQRSGGFWVIDCYLTQGMIYQARGQHQEALESMRFARQQASHTQANPFDDIYSATYEARLFIDQGDLDSAMKWANERGLLGSNKTGSGGPQEDLHTRFFTLYQLQQTTLARLFIAQKDHREALDILDLLFVEVKRMDRKENMLENLILQALAYSAMGMGDVAITKLKDALPLGESSGNIRKFLDERKPLRRLLRATVEKGDESWFVSRLLEAFEKGASPYNIGALPANTFEPLSEREQQVLRLLQSQLSAPQIADELVISVSTVRSHVKSIYSKLGVHSRYEAVAKASDLGLL